ncbi:hypothetical protein ARMGADRAFT_1026461 [Armillaria gallica]|uniref:Uncharacterized protein n=1 Tax=Armillaria gallica TaxID=47427 RepID=A0A2H3EAS4_ARMGA|nr:hypothetical protein ARMGADRAFT_1026461 [Armillaria gallica]
MGEKGDRVVVSDGGGGGWWNKRLWWVAICSDELSRSHNSGDGGLYAELLQNRAFQQVAAGTSAALKAWYSVNSALLTVVAETEPVSSALPNALNVTIASDATGLVGFGNTGYFGRGLSLIREQTCHDTSLQG